MTKIDCYEKQQAYEMKRIDFDSNRKIGEIDMG